MTAPDVLDIKGLHGFYGESHVLHGIDLSVAPGEVVTLLGRNGAGKTTTLRAIMGILEKRTGSISLFGREVISLSSNRIARLGVGYVPEERGIFSSLDVTENLLLPPALGDQGLSLPELYALFPNLQERRRSQGTRLSGGEQQMLALARVLRTGARFLLLDEPTEGLAPLIVEQIGRVIRQTKERGLTILLVEQNFRFAARLADRHYIVEGGRVIDMIGKNELQAKMSHLHDYLGV